ncbi:chalcone isomerase family protein [Neptunomonas japonica]|uniref:chalcone isomerase family protein n=1 Tax=Neptunomonas japonica TaxID=417574 RepID=UPI0003FB3EC7|nr:chalcone isomerase family protein [Neptunomonas japonica]
MSIKALFCLLLLISVEVLGQNLPQNWQRIGEADLSILWFDVYNAELLSADGRYLGVSNPLILKLNYRRNISQRDLLDETQKQIEKFTHTEQVDVWLTKLSQMWPSIKKGDQLAFWVDQKNTGHFFFNDNWIGSLEDPAFSRAFIQIWLSDKSSYPDLAKKLRGSVK